MTREEQLANIETAFAEVLNSIDYVEAPDESIAITTATLLAATGVNLGSVFSQVETTKAGGSVEMPPASADRRDDRI